jgi:hypothetical protein
MQIERKTDGFYLVDLTVEEYEKLKQSKDLSKQVKK